MLELLLGLAALQFFASLISEESQVSLLVGSGDLYTNILERPLLVVLTFSMVATHLLGEAGYFLALVGFAMAMGEVGLKWPRVALALPVSKEAIALTLWIKCVVIPSLFVSAGVLIIKVIGAPNLLSPDATHLSLLETMVASICSTGVACFFLQIIDALAVRYQGDREAHKLGLKENGSELFTAICFLLFWSFLFVAFDRWPNLQTPDVILIGIAFGMTGLSFRNRQSLVYLFESSRVTNRQNVSPPPRHASRDTVWRIPGFLGSYARTARMVFASTLVVCGLLFPFLTPVMQQLPKVLVGAHTRKLTDGVLFVPHHPDGVLLFFLLAGFLMPWSFLCDPPLRICRTLPLSAFQLHLRMLACPTNVFAVSTLCVLPFVLFFTSWNVMHALAILYVAFGFVVFIGGLETLATDSFLKTTFLLAIVGVGCSIFFVGPALAHVVETIIRTPSILALLGSLFFVFGNVFWYRGIAYASPAYRADSQREQGKFVL